jgi:hypothetical protein
VDFFDQQDRLMYYINKTYANNRRLSEEKYSASGKPVVKSKFWYNSKNQLQNTTVFYENDRRETYYTYSPGEKFETGEEFNSLYRFDVNGRISSQTTYDGVTFVSVKRFSYDAYGNVTMTLETDKNNHIKKTLYDYVYDFNSNWTLCVEYNYSGNIFVRKRTIIYFS